MEKTEAWDSGLEAVYDCLSDGAPFQEKWWKDICWQIAFFRLLKAASWKTEEMRICRIPNDHKKSDCTL